jgi:hypothetical protein
MKHLHLSIGRHNGSLIRIAKFAGIAAGSLLVVFVLVLQIFSDSILNKYVKPRVVKAFAEAYPAYSLHLSDMHYSFFTNRFGFDSVALSSGDRTFSSHVGECSVSGIGWLHLLWGGSLSPNDFANSVVDAKDIVLDLPKSQYEIQCGGVRVSMPHSEMVIDSLKLHPSGDDEQFFAGSKYRKNRLRLDIPRVRVTGLAGIEELQEKKYRARFIEIHNGSLDLLLNQDKPDDGDTTGLLMPNEILASIRGILKVDSLRVKDGRFQYSERFEMGSKPAVVTFDNLQASAKGISNQGSPGSSIVIQTQAQFVKAGTIKLLMTIPVASRECSFKYSGSLSGMDLSALNSFLEISDHMRIKAGVLEGATFDVNVVSGRADGTLSGIYRDLTLAVINKETGSEKGLMDRVTSFIGNKFTIRQNNVPGSMKIGKVQRVRVRDDPFFQYEWFALRTGVRDVVGF